MTTPLLGAVIGSPIAHSLSPALYQAAFDAQGIDGYYEAIETVESECCATLARLIDAGVRAISVTMPLKEAVLACLDEVDDDAALLRAVNCVSVVDGTVRGHNTDGDGCCDALEQQGGVALSSASVVVLGAGGTARSVVLALVRRGASVVVVNRTKSRAEELVRILGDVGPGTVHTGGLDALSTADVLVNTTSAGMNSDELPVEASHLHGSLVVLDAVYQPLETALLVSARACGAQTVDGLWMLVQQARRQCEHQFGWVPEIGPMRVAAERVLAERANHSGTDGHRQ